ncbi:hypothetical protein [Streptomyces sp. NPDC094032]|uniref:three-helix bundle dimerization domain-containing protein n=1 Tax=Streptomyces sp. NPDC094032 TaxID=3155308 RepID=UPI0033210DAC
MDDLTPHAGPDGSADEALALQDLVARLVVAYPSLDPAAVEAAVRSAYAHFEQATVRSFLPILVERRSRKALDAARVAAGVRSGDHDRGGRHDS